MNNLLKVDFYRMFKSKTTIVAIIISCLVPLFLVGVVAAISLSSVTSEESFTEVGKTILGGGGVFGTLLQLNYSPYGYNGIILIIFGALFASVDINSGSLRNKVICGYKRSTIFFSQLIVSLIYFVVLITVSGLIFDLGTTLILDFNPFEYFDIKYMIMVILNGIATYLLVSSLQICLLFGLKNTPLSIIAPIAMGLICYLISSLGPLFLMLNEDLEWLKYVLDVIPTYTLKVPTSLLSGDESFEAWESWITIGSCLLFTGINVGLGLLLFNKKDMK